MNYKEEFLKAFESPENIETVNEMYLVIKPYEEKLNKDLVEFTEEETREMFDNIKKYARFSYISGLIFQYIEFVKEINKDIKI
jgi:hypothetical protein